MKILITGGSGILGNALKQHFPETNEEVWYPSHEDFDITDGPLLTKSAPDLVIHCAAAKRGRTKEELRDVNILGTYNVVDYCNRVGTKLAYISTDYVFSGEEGNYRPEDNTNPVDYYGETKLAGEYIVKSLEDYLIIRLSFFPDQFPYDQAFIDQTTTRITVSEAAKRIAELVNSDLTGIHHICGEKQSVYDFAMKTTTLQVREARRPKGTPKDTSLLPSRKNVMVAGGEGYLGSVICNLLADDDYNVTSVDLGWFPTILDNRVNIVRDDLFNVDNLRDYYSVIFVAGMSNDPMCDIDPENAIKYNVDLPFQLAMVAKQSGVEKFIHAGSCSVYGFQGDLLLNENSPTLTSTFYGMSKLQGETKVVDLASKNFQVTSLRMGTLSGHSPRMRFDLILNAMYKCALFDGEIIVNDPNVYRPVLFVQDAARYYKKIIESDDNWNGVYNLAGRYDTVDNFALDVKKFLKNSPNINYLSIRDNRSYKVDNYCKFGNFADSTQILEDLDSNLYRDVDEDKYYNKRFSTKEQHAIASV